MFPITDGGFGNIDTKGDTCCEDANQRCGDPSLTRFEGRGEGTPYTALGMDRARSKGVFDLELSTAGRKMMRRAYQIVKPVNGCIIIVRQTFPDGCSSQELLVLADMTGYDGAGICLVLYCTKTPIVGQTREEMRAFGSMLWVCHCSGEGLS